MASSIASRIEASFHKQGLMGTLGARITRIEPGCVEITAPLTPATQQQQGFAHAGLTFAIGDSAAGYSALSVMPAETEVLTSEMSIHLLAPGAGEELIARGRVIRAGRRLVVAGADVFVRHKGKETLIATLIGTMVPVPV